MNNPPRSVVRLGQPEHPIVSDCAVLGSLLIGPGVLTRSYLGQPGNGGIWARVRWCSGGGLQDLRNTDEHWRNSTPEAVELDQSQPAQITEPHENDDFHEFLLRAGFPRVE